MSLRQEAIKGVMWSAAENWGGQFTTFVVFFILARLLEPEVFGLVALAGLFIAFMQVFLDQGFSEAIIQRQEVDSDYLSTAFWTNFLMGVVLSISSVAMAGFVAAFFKQPQLIPIVRWLSVGFIFSSLSSVQNAILSRKLAFKSIALRSLTANVIGSVVGILMAISGYGVWSLVSQQLVSGAIGVLVLWRVSDWRPTLRFSTKLLKELLSFGVSGVGFKILNFFNRRSDDLLIGYFLGAVQLGYYTVAYRLLLAMTQILISTISKVALPTFSRLQQDRERIQRAFYMVTQMSAFIALPVFVGVAVLAPELVQVLFGKQWMLSVPVMQILSLIGPLHAVFFYNSTVLVALGKPGWRLGIHLLNTGVNVVSFFLVVHWGIIAVASAYVVRGYLLAPVSILAIKKLIHIKASTYLAQYTSPLIGTLLMATGMLLIKYLLQSFSSLYLVIMISTSVGALIYTLAIMLFAPRLFQQIFEILRSALLKRKQA